MSVSAHAQEFASLEAQPLVLTIRPMGDGQARLDEAFARQEASARRILASVCAGCGLADADGPDITVTGLLPAAPPAP